jgi:hypothetical protein
MLSAPPRQGPSSVLHFFAGMAAVALLYVLVFKLNAWLFSVARVTDHISWIFLPAAIRMLAVMLLGWAGVAGLYIGSLSLLGSMFEFDPVGALIVAGLSSVPCLIAARLVQRLLKVSSDLAGLTGRQLLIFGLAGGFLSSMGHTLYFAYAAQSLAPVEGFLPMFVGDTLGTFIVLYLGALILNWVLPADKGD